MNSVCLTGNLTKDIEVKRTQSNLSVCSFSVGVRRKFKNDKGEYESDFVNCIAWRQSADYLGQYAHKGDKLAINGSLQTRSYDNQQGQKVYVTEVVCDSVEIVHSGEAKPSKASNNNVDDSLGFQSAMGNSNTLDISPDDLPFY